MPWIEQLRLTDWNLAAGLCLGAYALGCFTAAYYLVRLWTGQDIRELGSCSVGAKNAGRILGATGFLLTLVLDFGKGSFTVWGARHFTNDNHLIMMAMLAVVAGHIWPVQLRFHGGKGIATSLGALAMYDFYLALTFVILFLCALPFLRRTVLPGLFAFACLPLAAFLFSHYSINAALYDSINVTLLSMLAALVLVVHHKNLIEEILHLAHRDVHPETDESKSL